MKRKKQIAIIRCAGQAALRKNEGEAAACAWGCIGCKNCVEACPKQAVSFDGNGPAKADKEKCIGCGKCTKVCPQNLIVLVPAENNIQPLCSSPASAKETRSACGDGCIGCGICERACPAGAIRVTGFHAVIDQALCIACGMCAVSCPRGVIHDANGILAAE